MWKSRWWVSALIVGGMVGGCQRGAVPGGGGKPAAAVVTVARPIVRDVTEWDEYTGRLEAVETVEVRARVSGYVEEVPFKEGALVKKGDLLVRLDARPFEAQLENMKGQQAQAEAKLQLAKDDLARGEKVPAGTLSAEELDTRKQNVKQAEGVVDSAKAMVAMAALDVEWTRVTAPIAGRISRKNVTAGNLITGGTGSTGGGGGGGTGTLLTTIVSVDPIYCYVDADEASVLKYQKLARENKRVSAREGQVACYMALQNEEDFPHAGTIDFVDNRVNPSTGTMRARGVFANPDGELTPGFFARFRVAGHAWKQALLVNDAAVGTDQNRKYVLSVGADNVVAYQLVQIGGLIGNLRIIEQGLTPEARVVVNGLLRARPGVMVKPEEGAMPEGVGGVMTPPKGGTPSGGTSGTPGARGEGGK